MTETPFIITIDTEGDDLWTRSRGSREITTRNAAYLPRFQSLCERFRFKPVYLANYEMVMCDVFVEFAREEKIWTLTRLLEDRFDQEMVSHRAGRWGFDGRYAAMLLEEGYRVDCSVTPGIDWGGSPGDPRGNGGPDYTGFPDRPYFLNPSDISRPATGGLLEVPMTTRSSGLYRKAPWAYRFPLLRQAAHRVSPKLSWLCPTPLLEKNNLNAMLQVARAARAVGNGERPNDPATAVRHETCQNADQAPGRA